MGRKSREKKERDQGKPCRFYLHGEVCRSPMAEKLFEHALGESNCEKKIRIFSAGISAMDGDQAWIIRSKHAKKLDLI